MIFYKKNWLTNQGDDERKNIATQMASSTKNWVSMLDTTENLKDQ